MDVIFTLLVHPLLVHVEKMTFNYETRSVLVRLQTSSRDQNFEFLFFRRVPLSLS